MGRERQRRRAAERAAFDVERPREDREKRPPGTARRRLSPEARALAGATLCAALLLPFGVDETTLGLATDEQQLACTSVAIAEYGELGIARGQAFAVHRPGGDAVAPYGVGAPLVYSLASRAAGALEPRRGIAASQSLYALLQTLVVLAAALCAGLLARLWGSPPPGIVVAVLGTAVASPLWAYASTLFSEPLLALALVGGTALAAAAARAPDGRRSLALAAGAGLVAGYAVLTKGLALVLVPFLLLPLLLDGSSTGRWRRLAAAAVGLVPTLGAWLVLEIVRFGKPLASYGGQGFTNPVLDGLWRLTIGPNKGLFLFFPLAALGALGLIRLGRDRSSLGSALGTAGCVAVLLVLTSAWWAWDGSVGWGPRLLVPLVPLLGAAAGAGVTGHGTRLAAFALLGAGFVLNAPGILQSDASVSSYWTSCGRIPVSEAVAARFPPAIASKEGGIWRVPASLVVSRRPELSPFRIHTLVLAIRMTEPDGGIDAKLLSPPWGSPKPADAEAFRREPLPSLRSAFRWPVLFSALSTSRAVRGRDYFPTWANAIADQVLRAIDTGRTDRALELTERLLDTNPTPYAAALRAESLRLAGRREGLAAFLRSAPPEFFSSPSLGVVLALDARDRGDEARARKILKGVAEAFPRPAILKAVDAPLGDWPRTLHDMTGDNRAGRALELPSIGSTGAPQGRAGR